MTDWSGNLQTAQMSLRKASDALTPVHVGIVGAYRRSLCREAIAELDKVLASAAAAREWAIAQRDA